MLIKDRIEYLHDYKRKEVEAIFGDFSASEDSSCLEIGAGDGYESSIIKKYFGTLVSTELREDFKERQEKGISYVRCDAENLPFDDDKFDFVFSSNVIEHIENKDRCFSEIKRVLKENGMAIHVVPSRTWKIFNNLLYYPYLFILPFHPKRLRWHLKDKKSGKSSTSLLKYLFPPIHGSYKSHWAEFIKYGKKEWGRLFIENGFSIIKTIKVPILSSGHGFKFGAINRILEKAGLSSSYAFFMKPEK